MSQQINLYEARLRPRHLVLTGRRLASAFVVVTLLAGGGTIFARQQADKKKDEATRVLLTVKELQEKQDALSKQVADRKIPTALQLELDTVKAMLSVRKDVVALLDSGRLGQTAGFSQVLQGFARQTGSDWWLTGFSVGFGGQEIEIRGKLLDAGKLPTYVQRLSADPAFGGRRFAALMVNSVDPGEATPAATAHAAVTPAKPGDKPEVKLPRHLDFVLRSENIGEVSKIAGETK